MEFVVSLVNAMCSEKLGTRYLLENEYILMKLVQILKSEENDTMLRQNALGALQKFSLIPKAQKLLIDQDIILWIIQLLNPDSQRPFTEFSEYTQEYVTALLMNLVLLESGK